MSTLPEFLAANGIPLVTRPQWGARAPKYRNPLQSLEGAVTHHSVSGSTPEIAQVQGIQGFHMNTKGWSDIAYSLLVGQSGKVYEGRSSASLQYGYLGKSGGTGDPEDRTLLAICAIGNFEVGQPSPAMIRAYQAIYTWLAQQGAPRQSGDRNHNNTACPGRNLYAYLPFPLLEEEDMPLNDADKQWIKTTVNDIVVRETGGVNKRLIDLSAAVGVVGGAVDKIATLIPAKIPVGGWTTHLRNIQAKLDQLLGDETAKSRVTEDPED